MLGLLLKPVLISCHTDHTARPREQQNKQLRPSIRHGVKSSNSIASNSLRKNTSVTFSQDLLSTGSQATIISSSSCDTSINNSIRNMSISEREHSGTCEQPQEPPMPAPLQYYYNPSMRCSAVTLDPNNVPARSMTFQDMLDEGDGKEGDLNQRCRNEQWKDFECLNAPNKKRRGTMSRSSGVVSANDLAVMRRSASKMKTTANSMFATLSKANSTLSLSGSPSLAKTNQSILPGLSNGKPQESLSTMMSEPALKRSFTESLLENKVHSISAGLAYGSKHIQMLSSCKNV